MFFCPLCNSFGGQSFSSVLRHIGDIHKHDADFQIQCGLRQCPETYKNYASFRSHVYRKHRSVLHCQENETNSSNSSNSSSSSNNSEQNEDDDGNDTSHTSTTPSASAELSAAKFVLKTREEYRIPQSTCTALIKDVDELYSSAIERAKDRVLAVIAEHENVDIIRPLIVESLDSITSPFGDFNSQYKQTLYFKQHLDYQEPQERVLGRYMKDKNGKCVPVTDCCYDVGLLDSLSSLLKMTSIQDQIMNSHQSSNGLLMDYCDGTLFKQNSLFIEDPCALQIQLYYDEIEVCNPIGSFAKKHKLGCLYYTLGNLNPKLRSSLKAIHLLSIVKHSYVVKYGIDVILEPVIEAIKKLEKRPGVEFLFDGQSVFFRGTVTVVSADNLAAWAIGGFKALASAFRKCQYCMVTDPELQTKFKEESLTLRTEALYNEHCRGLNGPLHNHISTTFGMNRNSALNTLKYFHVVRGLVPDIMHDILEGSLKVVTQQLLQQLIVNGRILTVKQLNDCVSSFSYGPDVTNKPSVIELNHITGHLKQSASQMWCLGRYLPLIIGDFIDEDDPHWNNYLSHLEIVDEVFAPVYSEDRVGYLKMIIEDFLYDFKSLYPHRPLTPKMHYLVHIPTWIRRCGPLMRLWCMRYEAKHSFFKHLSGILRNFKNISKTLAVRHQQYMCYHMMNKDKYLTQPIVYTKGSEVNLQTLDYKEVLIAAYPSIGTANLWSVSSATINGTRYAVNACVCFDMDSEHMEPSFGIIMKLLVAKSTGTLFVLRQLETITFSHHLHAYQVKETTHIIVLDYDDFIDHHPLNLTKKDNSLFISLKYFLQAH